MRRLSFEVVLLPPTSASILGTMRRVDLGDDLDRLRHVIRKELAIQHEIDRRDVGEKWLDTLTDMLLSSIDYGFDVRWAPKWVRPGHAHRWSEGDEHFVECLSCGTATAHAAEADAKEWYAKHAREHG